MADSDSSDWGDWKGGKRRRILEARQQCAQDAAQDAARAAEAAAVFSDDCIQVFADAEADRAQWWAQYVEDDAVEETVLRMEEARSQVVSPRPTSPPAPRRAKAKRQARFPRPSPAQSGAAAEGSEAVRGEAAGTVSVEELQRVNDELQGAVDELREANRGIDLSLLPPPPPPLPPPPPPPALLPAPPMFAWPRRVTITYEFY